MNTSFKIVRALLLTAAIGSAAYANPISGWLTIEGAATLDTSSAGTATEVTGWNFSPAMLVSDGGDFAADLNSAFPVASVTTVPWAFTDSNVITDFLTIGGFDYTLDSSWIESQSAANGSVTVGGMGWVTNGVDGPTHASFQFVMPYPVVNPAAHSQFHAFTVAPSITHFSLTVATVPDGGTTAMLLGAALLVTTVVAGRRSSFKA